MSTDTERQTGRTTRQMQDAPQGAVFVWANDRIDYPRQLAEKIGRTDLEIIPALRLTVDFVTQRKFRGRVPDVVVDHYADLTAAGLEAMKLIEQFRKIRETPAPYALVTLETLTIKRFQHKDEWEAAMTAIKTRDQEFVALKYHHAAGRYVMPERCD